MEIPETVRRNSTVLRLYRAVQESLPQWLESSRVVALIRQLTAAESSQGGDSPPFESISESTSEQTAPNREAHADGDATRTAASVTAVSETPSWRNSGIYAFLQVLIQYIYTSWLYRWLTDEPDPAVVVIDLRETLALGPLLARLEIAIRDVIGVMPTSGGLRRGFQLRARFRETPVRVVSFALIGVVLLAFLPLLAAGEAIGFGTFILCGLLLAGLRGTQSAISWAEIQQTDAYERIVTVFEPPDPPVTAANNEHPETERENRSNEAKQSHSPNKSE